MFEFLLNYITLGMAIVGFIVLLSTLIMKKKSLLKIQKTSILVSLFLLTLYFGFIAIVVVGFGGNPHEPVSILT